MPDNLLRARIIIVRVYTRYSNIIPFQKELVKHFFEKIIMSGLAFPSELHHNNKKLTIDKLHSIMISDGSDNAPFICERI